MVCPALIIARSFVPRNIAVPARQDSSSGLRCSRIDRPWREMLRWVESVSGRGRDDRRASSNIGRGRSRGWISSAEPLTVRHWPKSKEKAEAGLRAACAGQPIGITTDSLSACDWRGRNRNQILTEALRPALIAHWLFKTRQFQARGDESSTANATAEIGSRRKRAFTRPSRPDHEGRRARIASIQVFVS